jgi:hypothetical protein
MPLYVIHLVKVWHVDEDWTPILLLLLAVLFLLMSVFCAIWLACLWFELKKMERISMKLTVDWSEFVGAAMRCLRSEHPELELGPPQFKKDYGSYESIGDMYDFPTFIEMEIK